ncbi:hypothetical protein D4764_17G0009480 [Takifugu flavidus]|uniref:Uncharacterized protein n=1 Tax=Takifugu flavidus TaxID=433684 RepID=A0A5C6NWX5_9TELE|nr:hypothetical protein D4764_17G0009480 [Takifugu flavidus]
MEYLFVNEREPSGRVRLQGQEIKKVEAFRYLGSTVQGNRECGKEVKKCVEAGWNGWRVSAKMKEVSKTVARPAMLGGLETAAELEVAEMKMLRLALGVGRTERLRKESIRGTAQGDTLDHDTLYFIQMSS